MNEKQNAQFVELCAVIDMLTKEIKSLKENNKAVERFIVARQLLMNAQDEIKKLLIDHGDK